MPIPRIFLFDPLVLDELLFEPLVATVQVAGFFGLMGCRHKSHQ